MTQLIKHLIVPFLLVIIAVKGYATVREVTSVGDTYTSGEFRYEIENAAGGDTILVNVSGTVLLTTSINVPVGGLIIIGPFPIHFNVEGTNFTGSTVFNISTGTTMRLNNIGFINFPNSQFFNYQTAGTDSLLVKSCVFENNNYSGPGSIMSSLNPNLAAWFDACSFIGNSTNSDGGCFYIGNSSGPGGNVMFSNCTFYQNTSGAGNGGAIYLRDGALDLYNNTFHTNYCSGSGTSVQFFSGTSYLENNIFYNAGLPTNQITHGTGVYYYDGGGNVTNDNTANLWTNMFGLNPLPNNYSGVDPLLYASIFTDGYGMKYFPIEGNSSPCVDINTNSPVTRYDARKVWRLMDGGITGMRVDAGAVEFSPNRIITAADWPAVFSAGGYGSHTGNEAIVFEGNAVLGISLGVSVSFSKPNTIMNGFSQQGSRVPGPVDNTGAVIPAITNIKLDAGSLVNSDMLSIAGDSCVLSGISLINNSGVNVNGININGMKGDIITGCHIGLDEVGSTANGMYRGILTTNYASGNYIGNNSYVAGVWANCRNVISGNSYAQIEMQDAKYNVISNNFIGTDATASNVPVGITPPYGSYGILLNSLSTPVNNHKNVIGGFKIEDRNILSGVIEAIHIENVEKNIVVNNYIGTDYYGNNGSTFSNLFVKSGIEILYSNALDNVIGLPNNGNVIGNFANYGIHCSSNSVHSVIKHNYIGIGADGATNISYSGVGTPKIGVYIDQYSSYNMVGGCGINDGNYITNSQAGIEFYFPGADMDTIYGNFIGMDISGNVAANDTAVSLTGGVMGIIIGDTLVGCSNNIAFNGAGIVGDGSENLFHVSGNSIHNNGGASALGIDLDGDGASVSYPPVSIYGDGDGILPPQLISAYDCGSGKTTVILKVNNDYNNDTLIFEFYIADSDNQEGEQFIISHKLTNWGIYTDKIAVELPYALSVGDNIVATTTNHLLSYLTNTYLYTTSEFSSPVAVSNPPSAPVASISPSLVCEGDTNLPVITTSTYTGTPVYYSDAALTTRLDSGVTYTINNVATAGTYNYYIVDSTLACMTPSSTVSLTVSPKPNVTSALSQTICSGDNVGLALTADVTSIFDWLATDNVNVTGESLTSQSSSSISDVLVSSSTTTENVLYTVTATSSDGCVGNPQTVSVSINPLPNVVGNASSSIVCEGQTVTLTGSGASVYSWDNGVSDGVAFSPVSTTTYTVTGTDVNGCINTGQVNVTVTPAPIFSATTNDVTCFGANDGSIVLNITTGTAPFDVYYNGAVNGSTSTSTYTISPLSPTSSVPVSITDSNGCSSTDYYATINEPAQVVITLNAINPTCYNSADGGVQIGASGGSSPYSYSVVSPSSSGTGGALSTNPYQFIDNGSNGDIYNVTVYDANSCPDSAQVTLMAPPDVWFEALVTSDTCSKGVGLIDVGAAGGGTGSINSFTYSLNSGIPGSNSLLQVMAGTNTVEVFDSLGCSSVQTFLVGDTVGTFNSGTGGTYQSCPGDSVNLVAFGGQDYVWYYANGDTIQWGGASVNVFADTNKVVYVEIFSGSCSQYDSAFVQIVNDGCGLGEINNNVFTPDGDGVNDVFVFDLPILIQKKNTVTIYNRWGDLIQEINDYNNIDHVWDGKNSHGEDVTAGTYFYVIDIPEANYTNSGWIQVIR